MNSKRNMEDFFDEVSDLKSMPLNELVSNPDEAFAQVSEVGDSPIIITKDGKPIGALVTVCDVTLVEEAVDERLTAQLAQDPQITQDLANIAANTSPATGGSFEDLVAALEADIAESDEEDN